jgi:hypothetical protein
LLLESRAVSVKVTVLPAVKVFVAAIGAGLIVNEVGPANE